MQSKETMSEAEIHDFGVEVVFTQLKKEGVEIKAVNADLEANPQIVAVINNHLAFIAVRTACYPEKGVLQKSEHSKLLQHADSQTAIPYFASVGIANAEAKTDQEMSIPIKGAGFHVAYNGLETITEFD
jgi:hypothetical protein